MSCLRRHVVAVETGSATGTRRPGSLIPHTAALWEDYTGLALAATDSIYVGDWVRSGRTIADEVDVFADHSGNNLDLARVNPTNIDYGVLRNGFLGHRVIDTIGGGWNAAVHAVGADSLLLVWAFTYDALPAGTEWIFGRADTAGGLQMAGIWIKATGRVRAITGDGADFPETADPTAIAADRTYVACMELNQTADTLDIEIMDTADNSRINVAAVSTVALGSTDGATSRLRAGFAQALAASTAIHHGGAALHGVAVEGKMSQVLSGIWSYLQIPVSP